MPGVRVSGGQAAAFLGGVAANATVAVRARVRVGTGQRGLRAATRATGQATLVPYALFFAGPAGWRRAALLSYTGAHLTHASLLTRLLALHGHPAAGTPKRHASVYGGLAGYASLAALLARVPSPAATVAAWYLFAGVHGTTIPDGYLGKDGPLRFYGPVGAVWVAALAGRLAGGSLRRQHRSNSEVASGP